MQYVDEFSMELDFQDVLIGVVGYQGPYAATFDEPGSDGEIEFDILEPVEMQSHKVTTAEYWQVFEEYTRILKGERDEARISAYELAYRD